MKDWARLQADVAVAGSANARKAVWEYYEARQVLGGVVQTLRALRARHAEEQQVAAARTVVRGSRETAERNLIAAEDLMRAELERF